MSRLNFTNILTLELIKLNNQYILRQKLILIYKLILSKLVFFNFILYFKIRFALILFKFKILFKKILITIKKFKFILIVLTLYFLNLLAIYFYTENFILTQIWCNSIKFAYFNLI